MALLLELCGQITARGAHAQLTNMCDPVAKIAALYQSIAPPRRRRRRPQSAVAQVGATTLAYIVHLKEILGFLGRLVLAAVGAGRRSRTTRWLDVVSLIERTGADAMAIVFAVLFVVGFIFAYATADRFVQLGQRQLSAQLIGRSMAREVAPVMTAIILSGRSGAAFAAELGSMKVNQDPERLFLDEPSAGQRIARCRGGDPRRRRGPRSRSGHACEGSCEGTAVTGRVLVSAAVVFVAGGCALTSQGAVLSVRYFSPELPRADRTADPPDARSGVDPGGRAAPVRGVALTSTHAARLELRYVLNDEATPLEEQTITVDHPVSGVRFDDFVAAISEALDEVVDRVADRVASIEFH